MSLLFVSGPLYGMRIGTAPTTVIPHYSVSVHRKYQTGVSKKKHVVSRFLTVACSPEVKKDSLVQLVESKIIEALNPISVNVIPSYGDPDGSHIVIEIVAEQFEGKKTMFRHQLVYKAIWKLIQGPVHAVDEIIAKAPSEL